MEKKSKKRVTLSVDSEVYDRYRAHCLKKGIILSKQIELFIKKELERLKSEKKTKEDEVKE